MKGFSQTLMDGSGSSRSTSGWVSFRPRHGGSIVWPASTLRRTRSSAITRPSRRRYAEADEIAANAQTESLEAKAQTEKAKAESLQAKAQAEKAKAESLQAKAQAEKAKAESLQSQSTSQSRRRTPCRRRGPRPQARGPAETTSARLMTAATRAAIDGLSDRWRNASATWKRPASSSSSTRRSTLIWRSPPSSGGSTRRAGRPCCFRRVKGTAFPSWATCSARSNGPSSFPRHARVGAPAGRAQGRSGPLRQEPLAIPRHAAHALAAAAQRRVRSGPILAHQTTIDQLPQIQCWPMDGGPFVTLAAGLHRRPRPPGPGAVEPGDVPRPARRQPVRGRTARSGCTTRSTAGSACTTRRRSAGASRCGSTSSSAARPR